MRHYKSFLIMQRFIAEAWRELSERFLEVFRYPVERVLNITPTPVGVVVVQNEWDGMLRRWMIPSIATLRWLIYEATVGETPPRIYHPTPLNSIVLERAGGEVPHSCEAIRDKDTERGGAWMLKFYADVQLFIGLRRIARSTG